ncbi:uncharacterized protein LOC113069086 [Tachysurus ichikawai]
MLKIVKVLLHNGPHTMEAHDVHDDGSERTLVLFAVVQQLKLSCTPERFTIHHAFTATGLSLAKHNYPVAALQQAYRHLRDLPLPPVDGVKPLLLIGSDMPHLLTPIRPVFRGPDGGPIANRTQLGWSLQSPMSPKQPSRRYQQCHHITTARSHDDLIRHVE